MQKNQFPKVKNSLLELEKDFMDLKDKELKNRKEKIKRGTKELLFNLIIVSKDGMGKFEQQELKKIRPIKKMV